MPVPGDTLVKRFTITDGAGLPVPSAAFTMTGHDPLGAPLSVDAPTHLGNGIYEVAYATADTDATGNYYIRATPNTGFPVEMDWLVSPAGTVERWRPGDTLVERITVVDHLGAPVTGATFSVMGLSPYGTPLVVPPPVERGNGVYDVVYRTSPLDSPGSFYLRLTTNATDPVSAFEVEWTVGRASTYGTGNSLKRIRRAVLARFGDLVACTATATGTPTLFIDEDTLVGEPSRFAGREILFTSGPNAGQMRYITGSSRNDSAVTLNRPLPYIPQVGDTAEITNAYGLGVTFRSVHDAINYAVETARQYHITPVVYETTLPFDHTDGVIPVPADMIGVDRVEGVDERQSSRSVGRSNRGGGTGWSLDHARHAVVLRGSDARRASGWTFRITGYALPHPMVHDDDTTTIPFDWLVDTATSHLCLDTLLSRQNTGDWGSKGMLYKQNSERLLSTLTPNLRSSFIRFR